MLRLLKKIKSICFTYIAKRTLGQKNVSLKANGFTKLTKNTRLGKNVNFNGFILYGAGKCNIGDNFHSGQGCKVLTSYHNYQGNAVPYDHTLITKPVTIEDNVWLGMNVTIMGGVTLGEGCIIQAESVVVADVPKCAIAGGHPAKVFSMRDEKRYFELKSQGKFL
ncbi:acyltransferase [Zobellia laminariae]|uniref:acyltransferase n=1 Tax=Zobellia laminariae TaxID=248906 RepID=UPI0026F4286E|nr:acyltransferase [Zobellia laminariae]WKX77995.1 acyltransferase [Zobellia laminariae]